MSPLFITADFYHYQIITLLRFQADGRAAFFRGDAVRLLARRLMWAAAAVLHRVRQVDVLELRAATRLSCDAGSGAPARLA